MTESEMPRPSLADAFKGSGGGRAASLGGLLPEAPRLAKAMPETAEPAASTPPAKAKRAVRPTPSHRPAEHHEGVQNVAVYLDPDTLTLVRKEKSRAAAGEPEKTYDEILVDALDRIGLEQLRAQFATRQPEASRGLLQRRARRPRGSGGIQIQLRLDGSQRRALDELTDNTGAPSRSALVATAYRLHLAAGGN